MFKIRLKFIKNIFNKKICTLILSLLCFNHIAYTAEMNPKTFVGLYMALMGKNPSPEAYIYYTTTQKSNPNAFNVMLSYNYSGKKYQTDEEVLNTIVNNIGLNLSKRDLLAIKAEMSIKGSRNLGNYFADFIHAILTYNGDDQNIKTTSTEFNSRVINAISYVDAQINSMKTLTATIQANTASGTNAAVTSTADLNCATQAYW